MKAKDISQAATTIAKLDYLSNMSTQPSSSLANENDQHSSIRCRSPEDFRPLCNRANAEPDSKEHDESGQQNETDKHMRLLGDPKHKDGGHEEE